MPSLNLLGNASGGPIAEVTNASVRQAKAGWGRAIPFLIVQPQADNEVACCSSGNGSKGAVRAQRQDRLEEPYCSRQKVRLTPPFALEHLANPFPP